MVLQFIHLVYDACDKVSVKLTGLSVPFIFIGSKLPNWLGILTGWLGLIVMLSTLTYNVLKIYKEYKELKSLKSK